LEDRVVLITGGAGYLGSEISMGLASAGARVIVLGRGAEHFQGLEGFRPDQGTGAVECVSCDVMDERAFAGAVERAWRAHGRLDGLVNHVGTGGREPWEQLGKAGWLGGLEGTLNHVFTCTKAVSGYLLRAGRGSIINTASLWGFLAPNPAMYLDLPIQPAAHTPAAKGGVLQLTRYLAALWGRNGVRVNAVSPGWFPKKRGPERPDYMREITSRVPLARIGQPSDLVGAYLFLMSDASRYVTGQNLVVDGGYSIW
jgi:gluconate 5-dehydrogenase